MSANTTAVSESALARIAGKQTHIPGREEGAMVAETVLGNPETAVAAESQPLLRVEEDKRQPEPTRQVAIPNQRPSQLGIAELIRAAQEHPPKPVIEGLLNEHEIAGLHGPPESFKTIFCLQLAESLATAQPLLGVWRVPELRSVYLFETEMSTAALGKRLQTMFQGRAIPDNVRFASEEQLHQFRRAANLSAKFDLLKKWIAESAADVVIIDTCNPFFRGKESPNDETTVGAFFDQLGAVGGSTKFFVRHNHKPRMDDFGGDGASRMRGSGQFADVPDLLLELSRKDKRTKEAKLEITKFRHGTKPDDLTLWFDSGDFRLIAIPPVVHLLLRGPLSRAELLSALEARFGVAQRCGDDRINDVRGVLRETQRGHEKVYELNWEGAQSEVWYSRCPHEGR